MKILGIDPGSTLMGYGLIEEKNNELTPITYGVLKINEKDLSQKLLALNKNLLALLKKTQPDFVGVEKLFFAKNKKTAFEVAHARGIIMLQVLQKGIPLLEVAPNEVKSQVTGYGLSDKKAVEKMVKHILKIENFESDDNAADALAIAITTANLRKTL